MRPYLKWCSVLGSPVQERDELTRTSPAKGYGDGWSISEEES